MQWIFEIEKLCENFYFANSLRLYFNEVARLRVKITFRIPSCQNIVRHSVVLCFWEHAIINFEVFFPIGTNFYFLDLTKFIAVQHFKFCNYLLFYNSTFWSRSCNLRHNLRNRAIIIPPFSYKKTKKNRKNSGQNRTNGALTRYSKNAVQSTRGPEQTRISNARNARAMHRKHSPRKPIR